MNTKIYKFERDKHGMNGCENLMMCHFETGCLEGYTCAPPLDPLLRPQPSHIRGYVSTPAEKSSNLNLNLFICLFRFLFFLDTDPHLASVCVISISFLFRDTSCVCVGTCVRVCM